MFCSPQPPTPVGGEYIIQYGGRNWMYPPPTAVGGSGEQNMGQEEHNLGQGEQIMGQGEQSGAGNAKFLL